MKICPQCQTSYTDDSLRFCLQDGTPLADQDFSDGSGEQETVVSPRQTDKVRVPVTNDQSQNRTQTGETVVYETPKKSSTALIVALTALLTILAVGAGGLGVWFYLRDGKKEIAGNKNSKPVNAAAAPNVSNANQPANVNSDANSNANATPAATPTPQPTLDPREIKNIQSDIKNVVEDWKDALENLDLNAHLARYADTVDYYKAGRIGLSAVRADKQRAFALYDNVDIDISNLRITPDETGEKAVAVFDKEWTFEGQRSYSSGKVRQELQLIKIGGNWRISAEKDLQIYYVNK
jgi:ketosteroid isomerase-like protein